MTPERSRRTFIAGTGGTLAALAGCSFRFGDGGTDGEGEALRRLATEHPPERPLTHPLAVTDAMPPAVADALVARHRERARALLASVPASPGVPNELIAGEIADERERLQRSLREAATTTTPEGDPEDGEEPSASERAHARLHRSRRHRESAATLRGEYRAATDTVREGDLERRRDEQRDRLAAFRSAWDYRASDPVRAALVHEHLEGMVGEIEHALTPWPEFPDDPPATTRDVGYLAGKIETARALLDDLESYRSQVAGDGAPGHRPALMAAATWLRRRARRESFRVEGPLEEGRSALGHDLGGVVRHRFAFAREAAREHSNGDLLDLVGEEGYARAALFAATRRAAVRTFVETVEAIESGTGTIESEVTADTVESVQAAAHEAVASSLDGGPHGVVAWLLGPAFSAMDEARDELQGGTAATPARAYAGYQFAVQFTEAAVEAADELVFLLDEAGP